MKKGKKVHLIGICGAGMSAVAVVLKRGSWKVSGSDEGFYEPISGYLRKNKISFFGNYSAKNIPRDADLIVIGNHAKLVPESNAEVKAAFASGIEIKSLPEMLAMFSEGKNNLVITGSFGKSTCTALLAYCLIKTKKNPSYFIGAVPIDSKQSLHLGKGKEFVIEGDEYRSSNWDNRSKFMHFSPSSVLLISAEHDHINLFPTEKSYKEPYKKLVAKIPKGGLLVYANKAKNTKEIVKYAKCKAVSYSLNNKSSDWHAQNIKYGLYTSFDLMNKGEKITNIKTKLLGNHNIENIIGGGALLLEQKLIKPVEFAKAIKTFSGIMRRIELKTKKSIVPVYEGFGSSYSKTKVIFETLKLHFPKKKIIAVFEPHTFSWRNREALKWYKDIFDGISEVILLPPPMHGKGTHDQLTYDQIFKAIPKSINKYKARTEKESLDLIKKITNKNDIIVLISSGSLLGLSKSIPNLIERLF